MANDTVTTSPTLGTPKWQGPVLTLDMMVGISLFLMKEPHDPRTGDRIKEDAIDYFTKVAGFGNRLHEVRGEGAQGVTFTVLETMKTEYERAKFS